MLRDKFNIYTIKYQNRPWRSVKSIASVLFGLKFTNHLRAHSVTRIRSWFNIPSISRIFEAEKKRELSSAKSLVKLN